MVMYAAGILPITRLQDGRVLFLVGKDVRDSTWSDFGGKCERVDRGDPANTAVREFYEETLGCVAGQWGLRQRMKPGNCVALRGVTQNGYPYWMYVVEVPYVASLSGAFSKFVAFLRYKNMALPLVEKTDLQWVDHHALMTIPKRHVFKATIDRHAGTIARISSEPWEAVCTSSDSEGFGRRYSPVVA